MAFMEPGSASSPPATSWEATLLSHPGKSSNKNQTPITKPLLPD